MVNTEGRLQLINTLKMAVVYQASDFKKNSTEPVFEKCLSVYVL